MQPVMLGIMSMLGNYRSKLVSATSSAVRIFDSVERLKNLFAWRVVPITWVMITLLVIVAAVLAVIPTRFVAIGIVYQT
jgi:hypothetical protein